MKITAQTDGGSRTFTLTRPTNLAEALEKAGLLLNRRCGGNGACRGCRVYLEEGNFRVDGQPVELGGGAHREALSCQTMTVSGEAAVFVPRGSLVEQAAQIEEHFAMRPVEAGNRTRVLRVVLAEPRLGDADADSERLAYEIGLSGVPGPVEIPLEILRGLPEVIAQSMGKMQVTLAERQGTWVVVRVACDVGPARAFGLAVDIGTTTVVVSLVDLIDGRLVASAALYNQQIARADDVAARISYCQTPVQIRELQALVVEQTINPLVAQLVAREKLDLAEIVRMTVSGNTVMTHLFLGLDPTNIGRLPFQPVARVFPTCVAVALGLCINPQALVEAMPCVSGYIGGDIVSDLYAADVTQREGATLLVDVGTNCEMVLAEGGRLVACAAAAGPAFEGAGIASGCRAAEGAIEHLAFDAALAFEMEVIGVTAPVGLCGSAIVDFIALGRRCGLLNAMGRLNQALLHERGLHRMVRAACGASHACLVVEEGRTRHHEPICVSEYDISQILKAKAAIYAGMQTLLATEGRAFASLTRILLAGGFAKHLDLGHAMEMGLLPRLPAHRFEIMGNGSLAGAYLALLEPRAPSAMAAIASQPKIVELNLVEAFQHNFIEALALPKPERPAGLAYHTGA